MYYLQYIRTHLEFKKVQQNICEELARIQYLNSVFLFVNCCLTFTFQFLLTLVLSTYQIILENSNPMATTQSMYKRCLIL